MKKQVYNTTNFSGDQSKFKAVALSKILFLDFLAAMLHLTSNKLISKKGTDAFSRPGRQALKEVVAEALGVSMLIC